MQRPGSSADLFTIEPRGGVVVIQVSGNIERFDATLIDSASELILAPIRREDFPQVIFDLTKVDYFGSAFLQLLLRCWNHVTKVKAGQMVLCGVTPRARELMHLTSLDILWPMYADRREALEALLAD